MTHLLWFFAFVYVAEGSGGLISQPLNYYLKQVHGWTPLQISAYVTILNIPWMTKPLYGLVSDLIPIFGYRRKSYLLLANAAAIAGLLFLQPGRKPRLYSLPMRLVTYGQPLEELVHGATFHFLDPDSEQPKRAITLRGITVQWPVNREMTDDGPRPERVRFIDPQSIFDRRVPRFGDDQ